MQITEAIIRNAYCAKETNPMIDSKILGKSVLVAVVVAFIMATATHFFFREWAGENSMTMAIILGGICGLIYPILARKKRTSLQSPNASSWPDPETTTKYADRPLSAGAVVQIRIFGKRGGNLARLTTVDSYNVGYCHE